MEFQAIDLRHWNPGFGHAYVPIDVSIKRRDMSVTWRSARPVQDEVKKATNVRLESANNTERSDKQKVKKFQQDIHSLNAFV